jgi:hypothetical protein
MAAYSVMLFRAIAEVDRILTRQAVQLACISPFAGDSIPIQGPSPGKRHSQIGIDRGPTLIDTAEMNCEEISKALR